MFVTCEACSERNEYIKYNLELIVKVVSPSTTIADRIDKYLAYTIIPSLKYYLVVEPETVYVTLFSKHAEGKWEAMSYIRKTDVISLPLLERYINRCYCYLDKKSRHCLSRDFPI